MSGMVLYGLLFPSLGIHLFANWTNPGSSSSTPSRCSLVCSVFLSSSDSSWFYICHSFVIRPTLISYRPTWYSAIVSQLIHSIFISPYVYYWVMVCVQRPALNMYVYNVWCLLLAFPRLDINLDLSTACPLYSNLRVVLVDNSLHPLSISCSCVCTWHFGENQHTGFLPLILSLSSECLWHLGENRLRRQKT